MTTVSGKPMDTIEQIKALQDAVPADDADGTPPEGGAAPAAAEPATEDGEAQVQEFFNNAGQESLSNSTGAASDLQDGAVENQQAAAANQLESSNETLQNVGKASTSSLDQSPDEPTDSASASADAATEATHND